MREKNVLTELKCLFLVWDSTKKQCFSRPIFTNYQENMAEKIRGSDSVYDYLDRLYYGSHKIA